MTKRQLALRAVITSHTTSKDHARLVTAAHYRYVVKDPSGVFACETDRPDFARAARAANGGRIYDRFNWRHHNN